MSSTIRTKKIRVGVAASTALIMLSVGLAACGGGSDGGNQEESPSTTSRVKNMPLNSCVSVMSGERPPPGVTVPRCVPTTLAGNPNKPNRPKKG